MVLRLIELVKLQNLALDCEILPMRIISVSLSDEVRNRIKTSDSDLGNNSSLSRIVPHPRDQSSEGTKNYLLFGTPIIYGVV